MSYPYESYQLGLSGRMTPAIKWLLIANGAVFLLQMIIGDKVAFWFGLNVELIIDHFTIWQFATYMFLHGGGFHIIFNMFILWIFGSEVERTLGTREFLKYYFITGIGAGIAQFLVNIISSDIPTIIVGASGAIYGVMLAFAIMFPERVITLLILFILPVSLKAKHLVAILAMISIFSGVSNLFGANDGVAHFTHLGGMVIGYFYLKADWRIASYKNKLFRKRKPTRPKMKIYRHEKDQSFQSQVDQILDKINEIGYDKLTPDEKNILKRASDDLSRKSDSD